MAGSASHPTDKPSHSRRHRKKRHHKAVVDYEEMSVRYGEVKLQVPKGFKQLLEDLSREVLREQPKSISKFAAAYFSRLLERREKGFTDSGIYSEQRTEPEKIIVQEAQIAQAAEVSQPLPQTTDQEEELPNLEDPDVQKAAAKIQAGFRGFRTRKSLENDETPLLATFNSSRRDSELRHTSDVEKQYSEDQTEEMKKDEITSSLSGDKLSSEAQAEDGNAAALKQAVAPVEEPLAKADTEVERTQLQDNDERPGEEAVVVTDAVEETKEAAIKATISQELKQEFEIEVAKEYSEEKDDSNFTDTKEESEDIVEPDAEKVSDEPLERKLSETEKPSEETMQAAREETEKAEEASEGLVEQKDDSLFEPSKDEEQIPGVEVEVSPDEREIEKKDSFLPASLQESTEVISRPEGFAEQVQESEEVARDESDDMPAEGAQEQDKGPNDPVSLLANEAVARAEVSIANGSVSSFLSNEASTSGITDQMSLSEQTDLKEQPDSLESVLEENEATNYTNESDQAPEGKMQERCLDSAEEEELKQMASADDQKWEAEEGGEKEQTSAEEVQQSLGSSEDDTQTDIIFIAEKDTETDKETEHASLEQMQEAGFQAVEEEEQAKIISTEGEIDQENDETEYKTNEEGDEDEKEQFSNVELPEPGLESAEKEEKKTNCTEDQETSEDAKENNNEEEKENEEKEDDEKEKSFEENMPEAGLKSSEEEVEKEASAADTQETNEIDKEGGYEKEIGTEEEKEQFSKDDMSEAGLESLSEEAQLTNADEADASEQQNVDLDLQESANTIVDESTEINENLDMKQMESSEAIITESAKAEPAEQKIDTIASDTGIDTKQDDALDGGKYTAIEGEMQKEANSEVEEVVKEGKLAELNQFGSDETDLKEDDKAKEEGVEELTAVDDVLDDEMVTADATDPSNKTLAVEMQSETMSSSPQEKLDQLEAQEQTAESIPATTADVAQEVVTSEAEQKTEINEETNATEKEDAPAVDDAAEEPRPQEEISPIAEYTQAQETIQEVDEPPKAEEPDAEAIAASSEPATEAVVVEEEPATELTDATEEPVAEDTAVADQTVDEGADTGADTSKTEEPIATEEQAPEESPQTEPGDKPADAEASTEDATLANEESAAAAAEEEKTEQVEEQQIEVKAEEPSQTEE